ncbi:pyridoxamine 5'-phosphate oxidase family protein [Virgibacillus salinus]|uniref:Nitroimidazol reductase NimA, pyridoxamine 5'-phosphate oxidase superfamily n=1 Tax=Virgibacillus salinus TaxID=553311 RepID=A0A1H1E369_9BACI|nr:pyridoxamine 5'-phosphate oxidase family protein [Virgibacillus salinus]SDQ83050.1 Nitroimidazol reductase NimA, pyridoxamine 5'-phosphate oxidase superfamily [Virgibacillus salinus]
MKIITNGDRSFDLEKLLAKPLFAHLATVDKDAPSDTPVWFHWEKQQLWIIGTPSDTFPKRIKNNPKCAIGIADFNPKAGLVLHAGFRGTAAVLPFDSTIANRLLSRYLGLDENKWDPRFKNLDKSNVLIRFTPETVVVRDQSYLAT